MHQLLPLAQLLKHASDDRTLKGIGYGSLTPDSIARIVQEAAHRAGLTGHFSGHSLRSGQVTAAAQAGVPELTIMRQTGHRRVATLRKYIRKG